MTTAWPRSVVAVVILGQKPAVVVGKPRPEPGPEPEVRPGVVVLAAVLVAGPEIQWKWIRISNIISVLLFALVKLAPEAAVVGRLGAWA